MPAPRTSAPPSAATGWRGSSHTSAPHATATSGSANVRTAVRALPIRARPYANTMPAIVRRADTAGDDARDGRLREVAEARPARTAARTSAAISGVVGHRARARRSGRRAGARRTRCRRSRTPTPGRAPRRATAPAAGASHGSQHDDEPGERDERGRSRTGRGHAVDARRGERDQDRREVVRQHRDRDGRRVERRRRTRTTLSASRTTFAASSR